MTFLEKWLKSVDKKNSVLCAGLDPAEFDMGRGEKGLAGGTNKKYWALRYLESVAPYCAAIKPNLQYWKDRGDMSTLLDISTTAHALGMVVIDDSKLADIGSTNDAGIFYAKSKGTDAVTFSPFAGNIAEAAEQAKNRDIGIICMCLMSNPEYKKEKNKLVPLCEDDHYYNIDLRTIEGIPYAKQYIQLAYDANKYGLDGIVIGAPSKKNHIKEEEIQRVRSYVNDDMLVLLPGVGAQGGEADAIWKYFDANKVIVNVGRALMLPNGSKSTPQEQAQTAKQYQEMLNKLRK
ncbi:MAG: orotidine 5'-phosphate decarboxylase [Nanoarchaeota archaeon]|nr:orotidine 5'-phosphate decarboxylase [Nanoarchaeota archaeon]